MRRTVKKYLMPVFFGLMVLGMRLNAQVVITTPKEGEISPYRTQAVIGEVPGANLSVHLDIDGVPVDSVRAMPNGTFEFIGVQTHEGPVTYTVTARFPNGRTPEPVANAPHF